MALTFGWQIERRSLAIAIIIGLIPVAVGNYLVEIASTREARTRVNGDAQQVLQRVEFAIDRAVGVLRDAADVTPGQRCNQKNVASLQRLVATAWMIKDLQVRFDVAETDYLCTNTGARPLSDNASGLYQAADKTVTLQYEPVAGLSLGGLRVTYHKAGIGWYSALMPHELMLPERLSYGYKDDYFVTITFLSGDPIVMISGQSVEKLEATVQTSRVSSRYPLSISVHSYPSVIMKGGEQIFNFGRLASVVAGFLAGLAFYVFMVRRTSDPVVKMQLALERGEFVPYYQPIINLQTGDLSGCEVLVRWRRSDGVMVAPGTFIDIAEKSGLIFPMTLQLMRHAAKELGSVYYSRQSLKCGFNLCAQHFHDQRVVKDVYDIFVDSPLRLNQIYVEVTERDPLEDMELARKIIGCFQELGIRVALDDVGTGHGGMSYLLKLGVDMIKIDKMFVDGLGLGNASGAIVDSLIELARNMDLDVVAEGVETASQVEDLRRRGVMLAQGYFFAQPMPGEDFINLVKKMAPVESLMEEIIVRDTPQKRLSRHAVA